MMENDDCFKVQLKRFQIMHEYEEWEYLSQEIFKVFLKDGMFSHYAMGVYYKYEKNPIQDPCDMKDSLNQLQKINAPKQYKDEYIDIIKTFGIVSLEDTKRKIFIIRQFNESFADQLEKALLFVTTQKQQKTLFHYLNVFKTHFNDKEIIELIRESLFSQNNNESVQKAIEATLKLPSIDATEEQLKYVRKVFQSYYPQFEEQLAKTKTTLKIKQFQALIDEKQLNLAAAEILKLVPNEFTTTDKAKEFYEEEVLKTKKQIQDQFILEIYELQSNCIKSLNQENKKFEQELDILIKSLEQNQKFADDANIPRKDPSIEIYEKIEGQAQEILQSLQKLPLNDESQFRFLYKIMHLTSKLEQIFNQLKEQTIEQIIDQLKRLFTDYQHFISEVDLKQKIVKTDPKDSPLSNFRKIIQQFMTTLQQLKALQNQVKRDEIKHIIQQVDDQIKNIGFNIQNDIKNQIRDLVALFKANDNPAIKKVFDNDQDIQDCQNCLFFVKSLFEVIQGLNCDHVFQKIQTYFQTIQNDCQTLFKQHQEKINHYLEIYGSEEDFMKTTEIINHVKQIQYMNQVPLLTDKIKHLYSEFQLQIVKFTQNTVSSIQENLNKLNEANLISEKETLIQKLSIQVENYKYFWSNIDESNKEKEILKDRLINYYYKFMKKYQKKISVNSIEDPKQWLKIQNIGSILDTYNDIQKVFVEFQKINHKSDYIEKIQQVVQKALTIIKEQLERPLDFMRVRHYEDFANYHKYLEIIDENKNLFLQNKEDLILLFQLQEYIQKIYQSQEIRLRQQFDYRYQKILLKSVKEENKLNDAQRVAPMHFDLDNKIIQIQDNEEILPLNARLANACNEIQEILEVTIMIIKLQITENNQNNQEQVFNLVSKCISTENVRLLYRKIRKSLLHGFFEDINIKDLYLKYKIENEDSAFFYMNKVLENLKIVDLFIEIKQAFVIPLQIEGKLIDNNFTLFIKTLEQDHTCFQSLNEAYDQFQSYLEKDDNEFISPYVELFEFNMFESLALKLQKEKDNLFIEQKMKKYLKNKVNKILRSIKMSSQEIEEFPSQNIIELEHKNDLKFTNKITSFIFNILKIDSILEFLSSFVQVNEIDEQLKVCLKILQDKFDQLLKLQEQLASQNQFYISLINLHAIHQIIEKIQNYQYDQNDIEFPTKNSFQQFLDNYRTKRQITNKIILENLQETFNKLKKVELGANYHQDQLPKAIIDSFDIKDEKMIQNFEVQAIINDYIKFKQNQYTQLIQNLSYIECNTDEELMKILDQIKKLRDQLKYHPVKNFLKFTQDIDNLEQQTKLRKFDHYKNSLKIAFEARDPLKVVSVIRNHKSQANENLEDIKSKLIVTFEQLCLPFDQIMQKEELDNLQLQSFLKDNIQIILAFLNQKELKDFIPDKCQQMFEQNVKDQINTLYKYSMLYISKKIEIGSGKIDKYDEMLQQIKKPLKIVIQGVDNALNILITIDQSKLEQIIIKNYNEKVKTFVKQTAKWCSNTVKAWSEAIEQNNIDHIINLIKNFAENDELFNNQLFIDLFQLQNETQRNSELWRALNDQFRSQDVKLQLYNWAQEKIKFLDSINFDQTIKRNNYERQQFLKDIKTIYEQYSFVANEVKSFSLFNYKGFNPAEKLKEQYSQIQKKVKNYCEQFYNQIECYFQNKNVLYIIKQTQAQQTDILFQNIADQYQNLVAITQTLDIIEDDLKIQIEQRIKEFDIQIQARTDYIMELAMQKSEELDSQKQQFDDLQFICNILIEMQLLKTNFSDLKEKMQIYQDEIVQHYDTVQLNKKNKARLDNLMRILLAQDWGCQIVDQCSFFKAHKIKELSKKFATKDISIILKEMKGEDIISTNSDQIELKNNFEKEAEQVLGSNYQKFNKLYQKILKDMTVLKMDEDHNILPINLEEIVKKIKSFEMDKHSWSDKNIHKLPELLAYIFSLWSLQKPEHMKKQQEIKIKLGDDQKNEDFLCYLNQPHPAQVIGIMRILGIGYYPNREIASEKQGFSFNIFSNKNKAKIRNNLVQIKTGEGKSITLAVLSIIFALCQFQVRCACYSQYLSERDYNDFKAMFDLLELTQLIEYATFNKICEMEINRDGDVREIFKNMILKKQNDQFSLKTEKKFQPQILLIDEVDVFFSESFFGMSYTPLAQIKGPEISALTDFIWTNKDQNLKLEFIQSTKEYKDAIKLFKNEFDYILVDAVKQMIYDVEDIQNYKQGQLMDGMIKYQQNDLWTESVVDSYKTMFAYYYYYENPQPSQVKISLDTLNNIKAIGIDCLRFSYAEIPLKFQYILGVTGTLDTLSRQQQRIIKDIYSIISKTYAPSVYDIPPELKNEEDKINGLKEEILIMNEKQEELHKGKVSNEYFEVRNEMSISINDNKYLWFHDIIENILQGLKTKNTIDLDNQRAVIVFFVNDQLINEFRKFEAFKKLDKCKVDVLTEKNDNKERDQKIINATNQGQVTLCTREFGRGTDFKYHGELVSSAGGLVVIQTFFTNDYSEEIQIRGRTRRQGSTGSYELIVSRTDLNNMFSQNIVDELIENKSPEQIYKNLHHQRQLLWEEKQKSKLEKRQELLEKHEECLEIVKIIKQKFNDKKDFQQKEYEKIKDCLKSLNSCPEYDQKFYKAQIVKTLVLMDATYSMNRMIQNAKDTIRLYFNQVCKDLQDNKYDKSIYQIQMGFYRNYSSGLDILECSPWTGPEKIDDLEEFLQKIQSKDGMQNEAIEIALAHACKEIYSPEDGIPVSLIFIIGDACANTNNEIKTRRYLKSSSPDQKQYANGWSEEAENIFGDCLDTYQVYIDKIDQFIYQGFKVPIYSFYLTQDNQPNEQLEKFFETMRINNSPEDKGGLLDLSQKQNFVVNLCEYTMRTIAEKNPNIGNAEGLKEAAKRVAKGLAHI